jgi:hypothetical protein
MKVFYRDGKPYLSWGLQELAHSQRTSGIEYPIWDAQGNRLDSGELYSQKGAGSYRLPRGARYLLVRYFTNSHYPEHKLYRLPELELLAEFDRTTEPQEVEKLAVPKEIKEFLLGDLFAA